MPKRRYSESHEWVTVDGDVATVGISEFAQAQLGDVVFLELPRTGESVTAGQSFGVVESVKAASDLYSPVGGEVLEVNQKLTDTPDLVNRDPYGEGWLMRVKVQGEAAGLMDEDAYTKLTQGAQ